MAEYDIAGDLDVNDFTGSDIRDLTQSAFGTGIREIGVNMELIIAVIIILVSVVAIAGLIIFVILGVKR